MYMKPVVPNNISSENLRTVAASLHPYNIIHCSKTTQQPVSLFSSIDVLTTYMAAQPWMWRRRRKYNLSMFYSNDNFIVFLFCSGVVLFLCASSMVQQLNTKSRLSKPKCEIWVGRACGKKSSARNVFAHKRP